MKSEFTLGMCVLIHTYLIWEVCTLKTYYIYRYSNENILFQYVDKIVQSSILATSCCPRAIPRAHRAEPGLRAQPRHAPGWQSPSVLPALHRQLRACHRQCQGSTASFERMLLATYCVTLVQAVSQSYFTDEKDKKGT